MIQTAWDSCFKRREKIDSENRKRLIQTTGDDCLRKAFRQKDSRRKVQKTQENFFREQTPITSEERRECFQRTRVDYFRGQDMIASESKDGLLQTAGEDCFRHTGRTNSNVSKVLFEGQEMIASKDRREKLQRRGYDFIRRKERIENFRKLEKVASENRKRLLQRMVALKGQERITSNSMRWFRQRTGVIPSEENRRLLQTKG